MTTSFFDIFGNEYNRNPNLIDVSLNVKEASYMTDLLKAEDFSVDELKYMVNPLLERLKHENEDDILAFLPSEIELMKDMLTFTWPNVSGESFGKKVLHAGVMTKLVDCTNEANLKASREKAKLIRSYDDTDNS